MSSYKATLIDMFKEGHALEKEIMAVFEDINYDL